MATDFKPVKRIVDHEAKDRKLAADSVCRCGCGRRASDGHHILLRSQRGDDVEDNVMPLAHECHMRYHAGRLRKLTLTEREFGYLAAKLGYEAAAEYVKRRYEP